MEAKKQKKAVLKNVSKTLNSPEENEINLSEKYKS